MSANDAMWCFICVHVNVFTFNITNTSVSLLSQKMIDSLKQGNQIT